jgi:hypothetical protein
MPDSQSAAPVWLVADARPRLVKALLMVEAGTASFYEVKLVGAPVWFEDGELAKPFGITYSPITYVRRSKASKISAWCGRTDRTLRILPAAGSRRSRRVNLRT